MCFQFLHPSAMWNGWILWNTEQLSQGQFLPWASFSFFVPQPPFCKIMLECWVTDFKPGQPEWSAFIFGMLKAIVGATEKAFAPKTLLGDFLPLSGSVKRVCAVLSLLFSALPLQVEWDKMLNEVSEVFGGWDRLSVVKNWSPLLKNLTFQTPG